MRSDLPGSLLFDTPKLYNSRHGMKSDNRRRRGWNYDAPPIPKSTRSEIHERDPRRSSSARNFAAGLLTILIAMLIIAACVAAFRTIDFKRISVSAALKRINSYIPFHKSASSSEMTPLPAIHNSPALTTSPCPPRKRVYPSAGKVFLKNTARAE